MVAHPRDLRLEAASISTKDGTHSEILALRYGAGLDNGEIADSLGISHNAVAVRLHRALKRLKQAVDAQRHDESIR